MKFIPYIIYAILISLVNITWGNAVVFAINVFYLALFLVVSIICLLVFLTSVTKSFLKKLLLAGLYLPVIIYLLVKASIFLTEFFDKFRPPW